MADENRTPAPALTLLGELEEAPYTFDFFQAIRRLDCAYPDKPPTGQSSHTADDAVRFGQEASMAFAPATLQSVERPKNLPPRLIQRFFGLLGPQGPLPSHLTEYIRDRIRNHGDWTFLRFVDVFHHRMISLFYRAWARVNPTVSFDQPASDRFRTYIASLFGYGMQTFKQRDALPDLPKHYFSGLLSCHVRHVDGLLAILRGYFRLPVRIEEFVGQWIELPTGSRCLFGTSAAKLGVSTSVGSHVWDCQQKFRIVFGPLTLSEYCRMLPGGSHSPAVNHNNVDTHPQMPTNKLDPVNVGDCLNRLIAVVRSYVGDELQWDLQLILKREETPPLSLGEGGQLGWTGWLPGEPMDRDPDDLILDPMQARFNVEKPDIYVSKN